MSTSLSGRNLADLGFTFTERELFFLVDHPDLKNLTPYLRGTYTTCQAVELAGRRVELDEAYIHIFETAGGCDWCKDHFKSLRERLEVLYQD